MLARLLARHRTLVVLCLSALCWGFSFGAGAPLASLWLEGAGCTAALIGLNTGVYYLGIAVAAPVVPWLMRRLGRACLVSGMIATGLTVLLFPFGGGLGGWFTLRVLNGLAGALSLIPIETLVNRNAAPEQRSRDFGCYAFMMAVGIALGTLIGVQLYPYLPRLAFALGGLSAMLGGIVIVGWLTWPDLPAAERHERVPLGFGRNLLCFGSAWSQGFLEGGMVGLMPVYLLAIGLTESGVGWLISGIMISVIVSQVPLAWLADRLGRRAVLLGCYAATTGALAALVFGLNLIPLALCLFVTGACSSAFYPLGLALLGERLPAVGLSRASAWFLGINCLGSLIGPVVAGAAMDHLGKHALFAAGEAAVVAVLLSLLIRRLIHARRDTHQLPAPRAVAEQVAA
jgi:MFS family permease